ncbi:YggS family pyridoxal phosphate-dependent enzyme [Trueperella pecoris]|uniref:YggS family pyridoxal phosphate-dependent enzyme n=1 Tax=Trueperella pecoris TaxID=2733571 RepID=UPI00186BA3D6|nr:YggS family pyridoxal phosphate-dependent enzyme [Trueperella pecoris]QOQ39164.1 YggS family pyridoxal phosphate-dependent enzyme [Trueperella pecoris]
MSITTNIAMVRARIARAEAAAGREPGSVTLQLAAKYQPLDRLHEAVATGCTCFGHNIVAQLVKSTQGLAGTGALTHTVIGPVQSNKLRAAMDHAERIDTVDSVKEAIRIARRQETRIEEGLADGPYPILIQVNSARAATQSGCAPEELIDIAAAIAELDLVRVDGLMTIGANTDDKGLVRASFGLTRSLSEEMRKLPGLEGAEELSMGMTGDMEIAVAEGSTLVRVGTAVFGARPRP